MRNIKIYMSAFVLFLFIGIGTTYAQEKDNILPEANKEYTAKNYVDAEANYRVSNSKFSSKTNSAYNLGNAIYRQNQASEAKYAYANALKTAKTATQKHKAFHNLGNVFMKEKNYTEAVEAYKNALRNNPSDDETRYNYALAKKMLKENPPRDDKDKKDDKKDKDKDKDKKDQDKKDQDKKDDKKDGDKDKKDDKKDGDKDKKDGKNDNNGEPKQEPGGMSPQRLKNLLNAVNNEEKKVQDKVNANKVKGKATKTEKDW